MVKTIFLTNDEDQNSVACEMPMTLTVTYAVIVHCMIETRTVLTQRGPEFIIASHT